MFYIIGVDIGGTKCAVTLAQYSNCIKIIDKVSFFTEVKKGPEYAIEEIIKSINSITNNNKIMMKEIKSIGISCGGPLDSKRGIIISPPNLVGWDNIKIVEILESRFNIKTKLQNDANACALAEWKFGVAKGYNNVVFLTFGTGMGAGLILDGKLYSGTNDMAGEVGHIRLNNFGPVGYGKSGTFEGFCSGGGIAQLARIKALEKLQRGEKVSFCTGINRLNEIDAKSVAEAAKAGDELAMEVYRISGEYLGKGISIIIDILNPDIIVIGSIFGRCKELLWPFTSDIIKRESLSYSQSVCKIVAAGLGEHIGDYAALAIAVNE